MLNITTHIIKFSRIAFFGFFTVFLIAESGFSQVGIDPAFDAGTAIHSVLYEEFDLTMIPSSLLKVKNSIDQYFLLVDKSIQKLYLYKYDGKFHRVKTLNCTTGANSGDKWENGDLKTPEGIYFFTNVWQDKDLVRQYGEKEAVQYGIRAYNTSYPNVIDKMNNKNGYGIWLHATDNPERIQQPYDTKGCIVIQNNDMEDLTPFITLGKTPIIVVKELKNLPERAIEIERSRIEQFIEAWRSSWESREIKWYEEFYSRTFKSGEFEYNGWIHHKKLIFSQYSRLNITVSELQILKFDEYYLAEFYQIFQSELYEDSGIKQLYIRHDGEGNELKIISEFWTAQNEIKK